MKRIGILTSGGDAPGMNAAIRAVVRTAAYHGIEVMGFRRGYEGLMGGQMSPIGPRNVGNIIHLGGTILETARCPEFKTREGRTKAITNLKNGQLEAMVIIGGDGTLRGATALAEESGLPVIGVPSTIDNDVYGTDFTIGFDTAVNTALEAVDRIRDTARSHERLFFIEVMGRTRGFIALMSGLAAGAENIIIPEVPIDINEVCTSLETNLKTGKRGAIIIVAEAGEPGYAFKVAEDVRRRSGVDSRVCILGHVQRGGSPTARDRVLASRFGAAAVEALLAGKKKHIVGEIKGEIVHTALEDACGERKELDSSLISLMKMLAR